MRPSSITFSTESERALEREVDPGPRPPKDVSAGGLPPPVRRSLEESLGPVGDARPVTGGCISHALRVEVSGQPLFVKFDPDPPERFFSAEAEGLQALAAVASPLRIPSVLGVGESADFSWIALEWIESQASIDHGKRLGRGLAAIHRAKGADWGWPRPGFIGRLPQSNTSAPTWGEFWVNERLEPQFERAGATRLARLHDEWRQLRASVPSLLEPAEDDGPSLLHGDLWSGNVMNSTDGPALIDPSCYYGHREVDLAMADLFGGFDRSFWKAYLSAWPLAAGYEVRRWVYQLYYLLVHINLFGDSYVEPTERTLRQILARSQ